jgi:xylan 1,4-beta-xylosidase
MLELFGNFRLCSIYKDTKSDPRLRLRAVERIDEDHANPRRLWHEMGEPEYLSHIQVEQLEASSFLVKEPLNWKFENQTIQLDVDLPSYAVAAITLEF